eukprot:TRINITY_DN5012_c1_g1_i1.p1 TRINITY_DN5012_c1_g1~~TRINITY_DN5012_c1_g1_i1.p1  ORF type:complete len:1402 (-),score=384.81 TRINITY_DN5012_c1_g1_i1:83-4288(-)
MLRAGKGAAKAVTMRLKKQSYDHTNTTTAVANANSEVLPECHPTFKVARTIIARERTTAHLLSGALFTKEATAPATRKIFQAAQSTRNLTFTPKQIPMALTDLADSVLDDIMRCVMFPLDKKDARSTYIRTLLGDNFKIIRELAYGVGSGPPAAEVLSIWKTFAALPNEILTELAQRKEMLDTCPHPDYTSPMFIDHTQYKAWRIEQDVQINKLVADLKNEQQADDVLEVMMISGHNLAIRDKHTQSSDPYVIMKLKRFDPAKKKRKQQARTAVVQQNLNPVWKEKHEFPLPHEWSSDGFMKMEVWDKDPQADDFAGGATVPLAPVHDTPYITQPKTVPLEHAKKGLLSKFRAYNSDKSEALGEVKLSLTLLRRRAPLPVGARASSGTPVNYHQRMELLTRTIITEDTCSLRPEVEWLLGEYCKRYGVSRLFTRLCILQQLVLQFRLFPPYLRALGLACRDVLAELQSSHTFATTKETTWCADVTQELMDNLKQLLSRYAFAFPVDEKGQCERGSLAACIDLMYGLTEMRAAIDALGKARVPSPDLAAAVTAGTSEYKRQGHSRASVVSPLRPIPDSPPSSSAHPPTPSSWFASSFLSRPPKSSSHLTPPLEELLDKCIKQCASFCFNLWAEDHTRAGAEVVGQEVVTLLETIQSVTTMIELDSDVYAHEAPKAFQWARRSARAYYPLLVDKVREVFEASPPLISETFVVCDLLANFHSVYGSYIEGLERLDLDDLFGQYVSLWVQQAGQRMRDWSKKAVSLDKWKPIYARTAEGNEPGDGKAVLHSSSVVDVFAAIDQARLFLINLPIDPGPHIFTFAQVAGSVAESYVAQLKALSIDDILQNAGEVTADERDLRELFRSSGARAPAGAGASASAGLPIDKAALTNIDITASPTICVRLNNMSTARELFASVIDSLQEHAPEDVSGEFSLDDAVQESFVRLRSDTNELIEVIVGRTNIPMHTAVLLALRNPPIKSAAIVEDDLDIRLEPLLSYLNAELETLSGNLYFAVCQRVLRAIWPSLIGNVETLLLPDTLHVHGDGELVARTAALSETLIDSRMVPFFNADGEGLPLQVLNKNLELLRAALPLFQLPTPALIDLYRTLEENPKAPLLRPIHVLAVLSSRSKVDEKARVFVVAQDALASHTELRELYGMEASKGRVISRNRCYYTNNGNMSVDLTLTEGHLCWAPALATKKYKRKRAIAVPLMSIINMQKTKSGVLGTDNALKITVTNLDVHAFAAFAKRDQVLAEIQQAARAAGNIKLTGASGASTPVRGAPSEAPTSPLSKSVDDLDRERTVRLTFHLGTDTRILQGVPCTLWGSGVAWMTTAGVFFLGQTQSKNISIPFDDVLSIEKKSTALFLHNALRITTKTAKHTLGSLAKRDEVYCLVLELWDAWKNLNT